MTTGADAADPAAAAPLSLAFGLAFEDLYRREGLARLDAAWVEFLKQQDGELARQMLAARADPDALEAKAEAALLIALAPASEAFLARLFGIEESVDNLRAAHAGLEPLYRAKWKFVKRQALLKVEPEQLQGFDAPAARRELLAASGADPAAAGFDEMAFARALERWQADEAANAARLQLALRYSAWAATTAQGQAFHANGVLFRQPGKVDPLHLLHHARSESIDGVHVTTIRPEQIRRRLDRGREAFALTDAGTDLTGALDQTHYCILCHKQGKDSCSKGLRDKPAADGSVVFKKTVFGAKLAGCPLEERISEFHTLKNEGLAVSALAMIVIDNPMVAATGHRICNDCMKACIYQKQTPVDIPQAETRTLKDVLELPWGFEIYSLLTRWNPLNLRRPLPRAETGYKVLVVGMGPAGFTLAHHLMNDGHAVVGVDGLKIEPLAAELSGIAPDGTRVPFEPVRDVRALYEPLDARVMAGFGGVAEYGITVRWNKNFLKLIRLLLERRWRFTLIGGVRFGGTLTVEDAWSLGFDHIALAIGAGRPTTLDIPNGLARGVRTASDFLMALQLTGAARTESIANMQLRLPVVVIGGGLTAIDTATESLAYYVVQVEKFLSRHETLCAQMGEPAVRAGWSAEEAVIAAEFIAHAQAIRSERARAGAEHRPARIVELLDAWGGVTIAYRKRLIDSPSYTLNHEEVELALAEGIRFAECLNPQRLDVDESGAVRSITMARQQRAEDGTWSSGEDLVLPARTVYIAAGTQPNTVLAREDAGHFRLDGRYFAAVDESGAPVKPEYASAKPRDVQVLLSGAPGERCISFFGDVHPSYFGNVVKAMGSARQGYPVVSRVLSRRAPHLYFRWIGWRLVWAMMDSVRVHSILTGRRSRQAARARTSCTEMSSRPPNAPPIGP